MMTDRVTTWRFVTTGVSFSIPMLLALKCGMMFLEVWFHLCILLIFYVCEFHQLSYGKVANLEKRYIIDTYYRFSVV